MNGEHHESREPDWRDGPGNEPRTLDELSRDEILRAMAGLDQRLEANNEKDPYSLLARGLLHSRLGDDRRAVDDFSRVIELEPDNAEALENRPTARDALGEHRLAGEDYDAVIRLEPDNAVDLYSRGACRAQLGDLAGAQADFDRAIALEPGHTIPYYNRGCTYAEMGDPRRALEDFDQAISLDPGNHIFFHYRGMAHRELGELAQAISDFDTAIQLEPLSNPSRQARVMQGDCQGAIPDFDAVLDLDPDNADALSGRGVARSALGQYDKAVSNLDRPWPSGPTTRLPCSPGGWPTWPWRTTTGPSKTSAPSWNSNRTTPALWPSGAWRLSSASSSKRPSWTSTG